MSIFEQICEHRSIRSYKKTSVPDRVLNKILEAGIRASSSGNMQTYSIIITKDSEKKSQLLKPHFNQSMVLDAPVLLTFCADFHRMKRWIELRKAPQNFDNFMSFMIAAIDATLVSQNVALAAEAEGLGICYMGTTLASCKEIGAILELPKNVVPVVGYSLGFPDENPPCRDRLPLNSLVHNETYHHYSDKDILDCYSQREIDGWARYMNNSQLRQMVKNNDVENLAQLYTTVKYTKDSHIGYSKDLMEYLKTQNFLNNCF